MGSAPNNIEREMKVKVSFNFKQILEMVRQLPDAQQVKLLDALKEELEKKGLVKWKRYEEGELNYLLASSTSNEAGIQFFNRHELDELMDDLDDDDWPDEDEIEMTDEEFNEAVKNI